MYSRTQEEFLAHWQKLLHIYSGQQVLCNYLIENQFPTRSQWATAWTSQHRHYGTTATSPVEGMHKVLKDYLTTSRGDLLRVVERIKEMVLNQYSRYQKDIATNQISLKFQHKVAELPFLPCGVHQIITPPAIELVRQQYLLLKQRPRKPCTGTFKRIYGLPCSHILQASSGFGRKLDLIHFDEDHWRYRRQHSPNMAIAPRQNQHILEPITVKARGRPRRNESSTRREPSSFERYIPPASHVESRPQTLAQILSQTVSARESSRPSPIRLPIPNTAEDPTAVCIDETRTDTQPDEQATEQPPNQSLTTTGIGDGQFAGPRIRPLRDPLSLATYLANNELQDAPDDIAHAHIMAQETVGHLLISTLSRLSTF